MDFRFSGLPVEPFKALFSLSDDELLARGMRRCIADSKPGFPCRVTLEDAEPGEPLILLSYPHQPAGKSPYQSQGPILVRQSATEPYRAETIVPPVLASRLLSLRGYDNDDLIVEADVVDGRNVVDALARFFANDHVSYVHIHYASRGCYACRVDRQS